LVLDKTDKLVQGAMARIHHCLTALAPIKLCKLTLSSLARTDSDLISTLGAGNCVADQDDLRLLWQEIFAAPKSV